MTKQEKSAGAVVYYYDEKPYFLLLKNTLKTTYWEFPKGKIEENENIEETAKRETEEETCLKNLEVVPGFKHIIRWFFRFQNELIHKEAFYILIKIPKQDRDNVCIVPVEGHKEHQDFKWLDYEEAKNIIKIKSNKEMLEKAHNFIIEKEKQKKLF